MVSQGCIETSLQNACPDAQLKDFAAFHANNSSQDLNQEPSRSSNSKTIFDSCITKNELAQHLRVSVSLINRLMSEEGLPHLKMGRTVRFRLDNIYEWFHRKGMKL
jgi:excisionase family DNA binding protein